MTDISNTEQSTRFAVAHVYAKNVFETIHDGKHVPDPEQYLAQAYLDLVEARGFPPTLICHPSIQLASGAYFDFLEPRKTVPSPEDIAHALSKINRCNGHTLGTSIYSVAQHCVLASRYAPPDYKFEALMHDAPESVTGDITTPLKQLLPDFKKIEKSVEHAFAEVYLLPPKMSLIVKDIDIRMAATEKRDLLPADPDGHTWTMLKGIEPYPEKIETWTVYEAKAHWLNEFNRLWDGHMARFI